MDYLEFCQKYDVISIPKIQREYVQGSNQKGAKFISDIMSVISSDSEIFYPLDLVFGNVTNGTFEPIDGQQRLTTLFLLYFYIAKRANKDISEQLNKFTYTTRESSGDFCKLIVEIYNDSEFEFTDVRPSVEIRNHKKYYDKYNYDYTVKSMLNMLDLIHNECQEIERVDYCSRYKNLTRLQFEICEFKDFGLSDELYVIMNDRGKSLSAIENLKSALIEWMRDNPIDTIRNFFTSGDTPGDTPRYLKFSEKMDNDWSENIWEFAGHDDAKADSAMYRIFCRYFWNLAIGLDKKGTSDTSKYFAKEKESEFDFDEFREVLDQVLPVDVENADVEKFYKDFVNYMDRLTKPVNKDKIEDYLKATLLKANTVSYDYFYAIDTSYEKAEYPEFRYGLNERFINFGLQIYLQNNDNLDGDSFKYWTRFVRNVTYAGSVNDSEKTTIAHINAIRELGEHSNDIYGYLSNCDESKSIAAVRYEIRKAKYYKANKTIFDDFDELERHDYLCCDIDWFVKDDPACDTMEDYKNRKKNAGVLFDDSGINPSNDHLVMRAILAKQNFSGDNTKNTMFISESDGDRTGLLNTQMHQPEWDKVIRDFLAIDNSKISDELKDLCKQTITYDPKDAEREYWHNLLCNNPEFYGWIRGLGSYAPRVKYDNSTIYILLGGNDSSNGRIILDKRKQELISYVLKGLKGRKYEFKDYNSIELDHKNITMFQYSSFVIALKKKDEKNFSGKEYLVIRVEGDKLKFDIEKNKRLMRFDADCLITDENQANNWIDEVNAKVNP